MAQAVVTEKYRQYEDLAARDGSRFHPNADDIGPSGAMEAAIRDGNCTP